MIEINPNNAYEYFTENTIDEIFEALNKDINKAIIHHPNTAIGCKCFENINIKKLGKKNVYVEYAYEALHQYEKIGIIDGRIYALKVLGDIGKSGFLYHCRKPLFYLLSRRGFSSQLSLYPPLYRQSS